MMSVIQADENDNEEDWLTREIKMEIERSGRRQVVVAILDDNSKTNKIERPTAETSTTAATVAKINLNSNINRIERPTAETSTIRNS